MEGAPQQAGGSVCSDRTASDRNKTAENASQFVLHSEEFDIHLDVPRSASGQGLTGRIVAHDAGAAASSAHIHLLRGGERLMTTTASAAGEFTFASIPDGQLNLQVDFAQLTVLAALTLDK